MNNLYRFLALLCMITLMPLSAWTQGHDYSQDYLTFNVLTDGTIPWKSIGSEMAKEISYSINDGPWTSITAGSNVTISVDAGDVVRFKGLNSTYAKDRSNYSGFDGGTATYDISGNIMSLMYGDNFVGETTMSGTYNFCSLFKQSKAVSAENLILPATTLTECCYRAMFSKCPNLQVAPALSATTLGAYCYYYMFEECPITSAPELPAPTLASNCYGYMFKGCSSLNYIVCLAVTKTASGCLTDWVNGVSSTGTFVKDENATWTTGTSGIPSGWTVYDDFLLYDPEISCDGDNITITCTTPGASIYFRLNQTGDFSLYNNSSPIVFNSNTTVEAYSSKDNNTSHIVIITFEKYDSPLDESNRSLDSWTYGGNQVTLPYSVNAIDGHSASYAKGTFNFTTEVKIKELQPTYLWFQHADQSAAVYVDNTLVEKHWGGYNAFFVDISDHVHIGTNNIKVAIKNNEGNNLAPCAGDFNFNATLGEVKLISSPVAPNPDYGYDGFHITSTVTEQEATITVTTSVPTSATLTCSIKGTNCNYSSTQAGDGEITFTTTITNPHLWNGTLDPYLYDVTLTIAKDGVVYHKFKRGYGLRFYEYVVDNDVPENSRFMLNGSPYLLRGVCMHSDLEGKANALTAADIDNDFEILKELGCNFVRLAHYPHPKEVYDWCDKLGIIVQTEVPCVNKLQSTLPQDYYDHLYIQYEDMVRQHFNHPCIIFWGLSNETTTDNKEFGKTKIEEYTSFIKNLDSERLVGYVMSHSVDDPSGYYNNPNNVDWFGCNIYVGWYIDKTSNNPTGRLNTRLTNTLTREGKPLAFSEYGCGGTQHCHSEDPWTTTTKGTNQPRHDIEYLMWLHEGHIAAIKNKPELLFTSQWQLFDIAVYNRQEGYKVCPDGETVFDNNELKRLNNKGLVERDHKTKKDPFYLYKAWWNQTDKFVHICGKDYKKLNSRVIKCYTNDGSSLTLFVNNEEIETVTVVDNIATFTARNFNPGDVIRVNGATSDDTFTFTNYNNNNVFTTTGNWNTDGNWSGNAVPAYGSDVVLIANATIPSGCTANADNIDLYGGSLTIADGGQLYHNNEGVTATVQKNITAYTIAQTNGEYKADGWNLIGYSFAGNGTIAEMGNLLKNNYDLYYYDEPTYYWMNHKNPNNNFTELEAARGYLYANSADVTIGLKGFLEAGNAMVSLPLNYTDGIPLAGFNLVGNPFAHNVTSYTGTSIANECYRMNGTRTDLIVDNISDSNPLKPGEGFFVKATAENASITFNSGAKGEMTKTDCINLEISENNQLIDRLIVKREGEPLEKLTLRENGTKIFAMHDNQEMAVVPIEGNEQAIYFKAAKNGTYTISLSTENTTLHYLHLIDNKTGADVDLLASNGGDAIHRASTYTFEAKTTDYACRFKLVFVCGDANDDNDPSTSSEAFAFINDGNIIITADVEGATLQVIDVMGRVILCRDAARHVSTSEMTPGTYVLRLINNDNVMTQKIVIR